MLLSALKNTVTKVSRRPSARRFRKINYESFQAAEVLENRCLLAGTVDLGFDINVGTTDDGNTQDGFTPLRFSSPGGQQASATTEGVTLTIDNAGINRDRGSTPDLLFSDFAGRAAGAGQLMTATLSGLPDGIYELTTYHFDQSLVDSGEVSETMEVRAFGAGEAVTTGVFDWLADESERTQTLTVTVSGGNDVVLEFINHNGETTRLNGLSVISLNVGGEDEEEEPTGPIEVDINVKPRSDANNILLAKFGKGKTKFLSPKIPVVVYSTDDFDAATIDVSTVTWAGAQAKHSRLRDVDHDGDLDLVLHFRLRDTNLLDEIQSSGHQHSHRRQSVQVTTTLTGQTTSGDDFVGTDEVNLVQFRTTFRKWLRCF